MNPPTAIDPSPATDWNVWYRRNRHYLWQLQHRAGSYSLAAQLMLSDRRSGDWILLAKGVRPDTVQPFADDVGSHRWDDPTNRLPARVTS